MKKPVKRKIVLKTDKSFEELIEDAFNDKTLPKKRKGLKKDAKVTSKNGTITKR